MNVDAATITQFGATANHGINVRFVRRNNEITIKRSAWDGVWILIVLLFFLLAPIYFAGSQGIQDLLSGNFEGDHSIVLFSTPITLGLLALMMKSYFLDRPKVTISGVSRTIQYLHRGHPTRQVAADQVQEFRVSKRKTSSAGSDSSTVITYFLTATLKNRSELDIASHSNKTMIERLLKSTKSVLKIR